MAEQTAAEAVEKAFADSSDGEHFSIGRFWMSLYEYGYEVVRRPCKCPCHKAIRPGLVPCPECEHSSRYVTPPRYPEGEHE